MAPKKIASVAGIPGADPTLPKVKLTLGDKNLWLVYSFNAIAKAEELTGLDLLGSLDLQNLTVSKYRALIYSALLTHNPEITLEQAGSLINIKTLPTITLALVEAWTGSRPEVVAQPETKDEPKDDKENPEQPLE